VKTAEVSDMANRPVSVREAARIVRLYRKGWSFQAIARVVGRNHSTVGYIFRRVDMHAARRESAEG